DLRQETHIVVNDLPVSWYASRDWANVGRSQSAIVAGEAARVQSLKPGSEIAVRPGHPVKHGSANSVTPEQVTVERASTEQDIVEDDGEYYVCITVVVLARPLDVEVDRVILAARAFPDGGCVNLQFATGQA